MTNKKNTASDSTAEKKISNSVRIAFIQTYEKEVTPERISELEKALEKIQGADNKIKYLEAKKREYLREAPPALLDISGMTAYPNFPPGSPLFWDRILQLRIDEIKGSGQADYSHREHILANKFKAQAGIEPEKTAADWAKERGERARQLFSTIVYSKNAKRYQPISLEEINNVIQLLKSEGHPQAAKLAINKKDEIEKM
jgi:hypothetical protein